MWTHLNINFNLISENEHQTKAVLELFLKTTIAFQAVSIPHVTAVQLYQALLSHYSHVVNNVLILYV